jgi:hypothetical protein
LIKTQTEARLSGRSATAVLSGNLLLLSRLGEQLVVKLAETGSNTLPAKGNFDPVPSSLS